MNTQTVQDVVVVAGMFLLRIGLPLFLVMVIGYLIQRWRAPKAVQEQFEGIVRNMQEQQAAASAHFRWQVRGFAGEKLAACTAGLTSDIPCWLARQIAGQPLPEDCAMCPVRTSINTRLTA